MLYHVCVVVISGNLWKIMHTASQPQFSSFESHFNVTCIMYDITHFIGRRRSLNLAMVGYDTVIKIAAFTTAQTVL